MKYQITMCTMYTWDHKQFYFYTCYTYSINHLHRTKMLIKSNTNDTIPRMPWNFRNFSYPTQTFQTKCITFHTNTPEIREKMFSQEIVRHSNTTFCFINFCDICWKKEFFGHKKIYAQKTKHVLFEECFIWLWV